MSFKVPERFRVVKGPMGSSLADGNNGHFIIPALGKPALFAIASDGAGWEHVSVSIGGQQRCPMWEEMCRVKELFWGEEDCVVQFHPPRSEYVSFHPHCLHLWRKVGSEFETPPYWLVGPKAA